MAPKNENDYVTPQQLKNAMLEKELKNGKDKGNIEKDILNIKNENSLQNRRLESIEKTSQATAADVRGFKEKDLPEIHRKISDNRNLSETNHIAVMNSLKLIQNDSGRKSVGQWVQAGIIGASAIAFAAWKVFGS